MGDYKKDSEQDKVRDCLIPGTDGFSDEELLKEFEAVKRMTVPLPIPAAPADEFEKIWARIQEERSESRDSSESDEPEHPKVIRPRFGWKRLAAIGLIACLVAGSGCMVAMGTKSYFYRGRVRDENNVVYNNDSNKIAVNGEEEAYDAIESDLNIRTIKLGYIPTDMDFIGLYIENGIAYMKFVYDGENVFLIQSKYDKKVSYNYDSDSLDKQVIQNKWLSQDFEIYSEVLSNGSLRYESSIVLNGAYYRLSGTIKNDEFVKIVERLVY